MLSLLATLGGAWYLRTTRTVPRGRFVRTTADLVVVPVNCFEQRGAADDGNAIVVLEAP